MERFLNSIKIGNIQDFDIDFDSIVKDRFDSKKIIMSIVKKTPWSYSLLSSFLEKINNVKYPYSLTFSYIVNPTINDAIILFNDWYRSSYNELPFFNVLSKDDKLILCIENEDNKSKLKSIIEKFSEILSFINYSFPVELEIKKKENVEVLSKRKLNQIVKKADNEAMETVLDNTNEHINNRQDVSDLIEKEQKESNAVVEEALLKQMKENAKEMARERERYRISRKGNYQPVELIDTIDGNSGNVDFEGKVFALEVKDYSGRKRLKISVIDKAGGAIQCDMYQNTLVNDDFVKNLLGSNVRIRGASYIDEKFKNLQIRSHYIDLLPPDEIKKEEYETNRVELHLHTGMSTQDAVSSMMDYCSYAQALGHKAIAITDHGNVQGFPEAQNASKKTGLKVLYGCEFYVFEDKMRYVFNPSKIELNKANFVVLDLETTGLSSRYCEIIEFGAVKVINGLVTDSLDILINPGFPLPKKIVEITGITDDMLKGKPLIKDALPKILEFIGDNILVTHNADFDFSFLQESLKKNGFKELTNPVIDTLALSRYLFPEARKHSLGTLCARMEVNYDEDSAHRADYDANVLNEVWEPMLVKLTENNPNMTHEELANLQTPKALLKHLKPFHVCVLAKNKHGLKDLYRLISISNIDYLAANPLLPRSVLDKFRTNLFVGSACLNGEVFSTAQYYNEDRLRKAISFYDYIEIQPLENYSILWNLNELSKDEVLKYIKDIISASEKENKIVCATGDVHYKTSEEKIFRDVYIFSKAVGNINHPLNPYRRSNLPPFENPDQHYRTTKEMLDAFSFLGEEKAKEIVIKNTNYIASQIDNILPVPNDKLYTPKIENCEENLRNLCYSNAKKLYGDPLPEIIEKRLSTELNGVISHGYSVIYYIAHRLVKKTNDEGYIVGSRGSVGSSFAATMAGITEVNPLPPHYRCPRCKYLEWTKNNFPQYRSGYDLPPKKCPKCGEELIRDGQDIPFETFLGFSAEKTPDIDLNFPRDYQARAMEFTKELLGAKNVYRAGTILTVADKTAYGFVKGYFERNGIDPSTVKKAKIDYLVSGCVNVKRSTGQHAGGIVVVPTEYDVFDFTPIQWPADEIGSSWKTTHFDFHSIHDTILKLDLLGHVDPMALRLMCLLTKINVKDIPLSDPNVLSLFSSPDALKMKNNYLAQKTGALALPEFGTDFVRGILEKTNPKTFNDLVIISGLSHGTDVWLGNAETLIDKKIATLQEVIGCRDDIMVYLISKGIPAKISFAIMEDVRKGKGLKPEYIEIMKAHNVPDYYISSCLLIKYMFPKGHAVAYVTMAVRVGYFKVYYPLEFYAVFFSTRSDQYDIVPMIDGESAIIKRIDELRHKSSTYGQSLTTKEDDQLKTLEVALEMVQRGYKFSNIDLYRSDATNFVVDYENKALIPPFITIFGLGESNAKSVIEARKEGPFISKKDLSNRTKLTETNIKTLTEMGALNDLSDDSQLSLFGFDFS